MTQPSPANAKHRLQQALPLLLIVLGILLRVWRFGAVPSGLNQDEAFSGYEAWSLLHYGIDSDGYPNPVYLTAWGSGMNALQSWLMIPFIALFGLTEITVRLPQLLLGCATLPVFYCLLRDTLGRRMALVGLALLAIAPWHIMLSRWALESNLAPFFLITGFWLLLKGLRDPRWWPAAAAVYGVGLYSYALTWLVVPLTLILFAVCLLLFRPQALRSRWLWVSVCILFVLALPLILFYLVNHDRLPEVVTPFLSIPRMPFLRDGELSLRNLFRAQTWKNLYALFIQQNDGLLWNTTRFGLFYHWTVPFLFVGMARMLRRVWQALRARRMPVELLLLLPLAAGLFTGMLNEAPNANKTNCVHLFVLVLIAVGIETLFLLPGRLGTLLPVLAGIAAVVSVGAFGQYYFHGYERELAWIFQAGLDEAMAYIQTGDYEDVWVCPDIHYPRILFYEQVPTPQFIETVHYSGPKSAFTPVESFTRFTFGDGGEPGPHEVYLLPTYAMDRYFAQGAEDWTVKTFDTVCVVLPPE